MSSKDLKICLDIFNYENNYKLATPREEPTYEINDNNIKVNYISTECYFKTLDEVKKEYQEDKKKIIKELEQDIQDLHISVKQKKDAIRILKKLY